MFGDYEGIFTRVTFAGKLYLNGLSFFRRYLAVFIGDYRVGGGGAEQVVGGNVDKVQRMGAVLHAVQAGIAVLAVEFNPEGGPAPVGQVDYAYDVAVLLLYLQKALGFGKGKTEFVDAPPGNILLEPGHGILKAGIGGH